MANNRLSLFRHQHIDIVKCDFGRGIFTTRKIPADTTLEECPYLRLKADECGDFLDDYVFHLESVEDNGESDYYSLVLGWGSLFNHADDHNTEYWHDTDRDLIVFHTIKSVAAGRQLFVNYGKEWWESRALDPE